MRTEILFAADNEPVAEKRRSLLWYGLGVAAVGLAALAALPAAIAWISLHPPRQLHDRNPFSALRVPYERAFLHTSDGVRLSAWFVPAPAAARPRGIIVVCHGHAGNRSKMLPYLSFLHQAGYAALLFDFRAHGWSGGTKTTFGHREPLDLEAALDWAEAHPMLRGVPIGLLGESMGASVALLVAAEETRVKAVVADSPYASLSTAVENRLYLTLGPIVAPIVLPHTLRIGEKMLGIRTDEISPEEAVARIAPRPVLLIHGLDDPMLTPENSRRIYEAAPGNVTHWEVPGARHVQAVHDVPEEYARRVTAFLDWALA